MPESKPSPSVVVPSENRSAGQRVAVLLPLPLAGAYDYQVPEGESLSPGMVVEVPLGKRAVVGVVWGPGPEAAEGGAPDDKLKAVSRCLPHAPVVSAATRRFVDWVAAYTLSPPGAVLKMVLSVPSALEAPPLRLGWRRSDASLPQGFSLTEARKRVLAVLEEVGTVPLPPVALAEAAGVSSAVLKGLAKAGVLQATPLTALPPESPVQADGHHPGPALSPRQAEVAAELVAALGQGYATLLLDGVTGSGKTEVYFEAIAAALQAGSQVLVLVPEITLTTQWLGRFQERFGAAPAVWHSDLSDSTRRDTWRAVAEGRAKVVVGARSALFLPFSGLGLIVVDEEHEGAFKQEEGVIYHARDMAVARGHLEGLPVILASATPSLESVLNAREGRYRPLSLPSRHGGAVLPDVTLVDLRRHKPEKGEWGQSWISPPLVGAVEEALASGEQVLLFLNRRGYAPLTLCRTCGHRLQCPHCTAWLVEHRYRPGGNGGGRLQCHHCGYSAPLPKTCPSCGDSESLTACGPGVERLAEEAAARFPHARTALVASDTLGGPQGVAEVVARITAHEVDLLIGTQVLAKGLHFPLLTLVGVIDADLGLGGGDLRAAERTFQLLSQVAGRAGRAERPGRVMVQTTQPDHPVLQAMAQGDAALFLEAEAEGRQLLRMPPFGRLIALVVSGRDGGAVESAARALARHAPPRGPGGAEITVLGPAPAPLALLRGRHRWRLLLKGPRYGRLQGVVRDWLARTSLPSTVRVQVDVDPYSFL